MICKVYHGVDRPTSFFGIEGRYLTIMILGILVTLALSVYIGLFFNEIIAIGAFLLGCTAVYLLIQKMQKTIPEKDLFKAFLKPRTPKAYIVPHMRFRVYLKAKLCASSGAAPGSCSLSTAISSQSGSIQTQHFKGKDNVPL